MAIFMLKSLYVDVRFAIEVLVFASGLENGALGTTGLRGIICVEEERTGIGAEIERLCGFEAASEDVLAGRFSKVRDFLGN